MENHAVHVRALLFVVQHLGCLGLIYVDPAWKLAALVGALYFFIYFGITAGYHRCFSHRSFRIGRIGQFLLAGLAECSNQGGVLAWAQVHERHHRFTDREGDAHSPVHKSKWWAYMGWQFKPRPPACGPKPSYFAQFPEIRFLDRFPYLCVLVLATLVFLGGRATGMGGWTALTGLCLALVLTGHVTNLFNVWGHSWGARRYDSPDNSRNSFPLALITLGEGWHNNHHSFPTPCRHGFMWWEIDATYYVLRILGWAGVVRGIRPIPAAALARLQGRDAR